MSRNEPIAKRTSGRFAYEGLERIIHEKSRLSILSSLAAHPDGLLFTELRTLCSLTDGNLSRQIQVLQENGYVEVWKGFRNNRPQTMCRLNDAGRARFLEYIETLQGVVSDASGAGRKTGRHPNVAPPGVVPAS